MYNIKTAIVPKFSVFFDQAAITKKP